MKKISLLFIIFISGLLSLGQSQRMVILEHFTGASCTFCAVYNPMVEELLNNHPDKITSIKYQFFLPDPMYHHCNEDIDARLEYYNNQAVPHSILDGNFFDDHPANLSGEIILERYNEPSPFNIQPHHELSPDNDSVYIDMLIEATAPVNGNLSAYIAVVEEHIHFEEPPGQNGETDFYNVLKKMLPTSQGKTLQQDFQEGDYVLLQTQWKTENFYNIEKLEVIGFVQDMGTREIHQTVVSSDQPITPLFKNDVELIQTDHVPAIYCDHLQPRIVIRNNGSQTLNKLQISASINREEVFSKNWTGNLKSLETTSIQLDPLEFIPQEQNELLISLASPNNSNDGYSANNEQLFAIKNAPRASQSIVLMIKTDNNPGETSWKLINSMEEIIESGGPYDQAGTLYSHRLSFNDEGCYTIVISDSAGNGFNSENGNGFFLIVDDSGNPMHEGTFISNSIGLPVHMTSAATIKESQSNTLVQVYPNPVRENVTLNINGNMTGPVMITLYNMYGKKVRQYEKKNLYNGMINLKLDHLQAGYYILQITDEKGNTYTTEMIKAKP
ncbi:MAG: T9SS type A sorting domain-containing protein [Bacteroidales bacterium]|nr:T9SS type A sorting domain-containing protein [Bacteroidales bacterium]